MIFVLGIVLFAVAILLSVAWHECGHMWAAQATGMKVRRYFVGFGPTLWSFRRGETEYGVKAIPLGGFCDIAGMTPHDEMAPEDEPRAMYRQKAWKRLVVLFAGPMQNFILGFVLIYFFAVFAGLPDLRDRPVEVTAVGCVAPSMDDQGNLAECSGQGPAEIAGIKAGDQVIRVNGHEIDGNAGLITRAQRASSSITVEVLRNGQPRTFDIPVAHVERKTQDGDGTIRSIQVGAIGVSLRGHENTWNDFGPWSAVGGSFTFAGQLLAKTGEALISLPSKIGDLWHAVTGGDRDVDTPVSMWGAAENGGRAVDRSEWLTFFMLLIGINFFLGAFNLVPLLPLDGGHMAIVGYEKARNGVRRMFGRAPGGPVDYMKLMPVTYAVVIVMGAFMVLTLAADIINPLTPL